MTRSTRNTSVPPAALQRGRRALARSGRAFTLIELLVVISVIALLISITLPALGNARETSRRAKCLTNLRSIGTGFQMYLNTESKGIFPYLRPIQGTAQTPNDPSLLELLSTYLDAEVPRVEGGNDNGSRESRRYYATDPYRCPSDLGAVGGNSGEPQWRMTGCSYEYVPSLLMLLAESIYVPHPAFAVTKTYEKEHERNFDLPFIQDYGDWHLGRPKNASNLPKKNACFFPDWHTDWSFTIDDQNLATNLIDDIRHYGG